MRRPRVARVIGDGASTPGSDRRRSTAGTGAAASGSGADLGDDGSLVAARDAAILAAAAEDDDLDGLAEHAARTPLDDLD